jgi:hypothetical protein
MLHVKSALDEGVDMLLVPREHGRQDLHRALLGAGAARRVQRARKLHLQTRLFRRRCRRVGSHRRRGRGCALVVRDGGGVVFQTEVRVSEQLDELRGRATGAVGLKRDGPA